MISVGNGFRTGTGISMGTVLVTTGELLQPGSDRRAALSKAALKQRKTFREYTVAVPQQVVFGGKRVSPFLESAHLIDHGRHFLPTDAKLKPFVQRLVLPLDGFDLGRIRSHDGGDVRLS